MLGIGYGSAARPIGRTVAATTGFGSPFDGKRIALYRHCRKPVAPPIDGLSPIVRQGNQAQTQRHTALTNWSRVLTTAHRSNGRLWTSLVLLFSCLQVLQKAPYDFLVELLGRINMNFGDGDQERSSRHALQP